MEKGNEENTNADLLQLANKLFEPSPTKDCDRFIRNTLVLMKELTYRPDREDLFVEISTLIFSKTFSSQECKEKFIQE